LFKRIIALVLVFVIIFSAVPIANALSVSEVMSFVVGTFGDILFSDSLFTSDYMAWLIDGKSGADACPSSSDGSVPHQWVSDPLIGAFTGFYNEHCLLCGLTAVDYINALEEEKVSSLDSTTAKSSTTVTGFSATGTTTNINHNNGFFGYMGYLGDMPQVLSLIQSLGISENVCIAYINDIYLKGYYFDADGRMIIGTFENSFDSISADLFGVYSLDSLTLLASDPAPVQYLYYSNASFQLGSSSGIMFYSKAHAEAYSEFGIKDCFAFKWDGDCSKYTSSNTTMTSTVTCYYYPISGTEWDTKSALVNGHPYTGTFHFPKPVIWDNSRIVIQPTGADTTTRTGSLMQTINNYNVDNSVVDNSSNVNYYISPKSYVTELPDDTIDIEQCYSPQSYDEETLVFTEPVTGAQILTSGWTYDYTTRTYDIDVPSGTTTDAYGVDITRIELIYGDEAVTYNYYLADDTLAQSDEYAYVMVSGDENFGTGGSSEEPDEPEDPGEDPEEETHKHSYTDTVTTEPTCEAPGIRKYTCDECGDSYTEKIDAAGHTWTVKQSVATEYDDTGAVTVQGYTIYKCSVCNTEYKDEAGTGPPNNSADNTDGEGIFKKIGQLLGSILSGLLGMIEAVLGGLLDGLVRLADLVGDKLTQVVEIVTGLFDKLPQLFGGFTALLGDVFVFIPEDIMTIFTFGAAAIVFVGILMLFIKR